MVRVRLTRRGLFKAEIALPVRVCSREMFADILDMDPAEIDTDACITINHPDWPDGIWLLRRKRSQKDLRQTIAHEVRAHVWDSVVDAVDRWADGNGEYCS